MATNLTFTGDSNDAQAAIAKIERKFAEMENRAVQFGKKAKAAGDDGFESFLKMGQSVTGITSTLDLASKGVALLANEYKALIALQDKSAEANSTFGATFTKLALNAGAGADVNKEKLRVLMLSTEAGVSPDKLTTIMSIAQAAKGGLSDEVVNNTIIEASKLSKHSPDDMGKLVGLSLDIQKANPKVNPRQALAFSLNSAAEARVDDAAEYSKNVMPAALAISQLDKTGIEFPAAAAGAFTQGKGDTTGRTSRTAILAMHFQLEKALPHLKSFEDRVNYAQDNPEFTKAFFEGTTHKGKHLPPMDMQVVGPNGETFSFSGNKASFETPSLPWAKLLLTKGSTVDDNLRRIHKTVPSMDNSEASFNARAKGMAEDPNMMVADTRNAINVQKELNYLNNTEAAKESVARRDVFDLLASEGFGSFHGFKTDAHGQVIRSRTSGRARSSGGLSHRRR